MLDHKIYMDITKKLMLDDIVNTTEWFANHSEAEALMYLYDEDPIVIRHRGVFSVYSDDMRPAPEIIEWCEKHSVDTRDFNFPVVFDESLTDCSAVFAYCSSFNQPLLLPENVERCSYMLYRCRAYNQLIEFPVSLTTYTGALFGCASLKEKVLVHSNITDPGELFRHATRTFISDNRTEEEAIYQANPVEVPAYIKLVRSD